MPSVLKVLPPSSLTVSRGPRLVDPVPVLGIDDEVGEVEGPAARPRSRSWPSPRSRPGRRSGRGRSRLRLDGGVDHARAATAPRPPRCVPGRPWAARCAIFFQVLAAVRALVEAAPGTAGAEESRPCAGTATCRRRGCAPSCGSRRDVGAAGVVVHEQHLLPGLAAVLRAEDAALGMTVRRRRRWRTRRRVCAVLRVDGDAGDALGVLEAQALPVVAAVGGLVDAVADRRRCCAPSDSPVPTQTILGSLGSILIAPIDWVCLSKTGLNWRPPSCDFQTPPPAVPA